MSSVKRLARLAVEHDDAHHAADAREEVVLPPLVVVERADHALPGEDEVRLQDGLRQLGGAHELHEPAPFVVVAPQRYPLDVHLFAPLARTKSFTA